MIKMNILGINMDCLTYEEMYPLFDEWLADKSDRSHSIALVNVHACVSALNNSRLRGIYNTADIAGIDGTPFLFWARTFYRKASDRFYAPDLMLEISSRAKEKDYSFFLYGGYPGAGNRIEAFLCERFDGVKIVGKHSPPFRPLTEDEDDAVCDMINSLAPDFVWVGLGAPKQEIWISEHREKLRGSILIGAGATFDFFSGRIKQAPKWIRRGGLEWLYRLTQDFRRLWKRYTISNIIFLTMFALQLTGLKKFSGSATRRDQA
jgi:N-acetylglucosaminyldiphosphoundecaprenol N-acetyl-beta-D-mannosaminyltransferase